MNRHLWKNLFLVVLAGVLVLTSALPALATGDTGGLSLPLTDKPVTLTWMVPADVENLNDLPVIKEISRRTGINLNMIPYPKKSYPEKLDTIMAGGDLPDIINGIALAQTNEYGKVGAFANLMDYVDVLPNFKSLIIDNPDNSWVTFAWATEDGAVYRWPIYGLNRDVNHGILYRADIMEELGLEPWTDVDGFYNALVKMKEAYPDSYPFSSKNGENLFRDLARYWNISDGRYPFFYDEADGQWKFTGATAQYLELLDLLKKMYDNALLDPEFLTDTQDSWSAKMTTNRSFVAWDWVDRMNLLAAQVKDTMPQFNLKFANPIGSGKQHPLALIDNWGPSVAAGPNEELALKLLDYMFSPEGSELFTIGIEGETFTWNENGVPYYPGVEDQSSITVDGLTELYGMWIEGAYVRPDRRSIYYQYSSNVQEAQDIGHKVGFNERDPMIVMTDAENETFTEIFTQLEKEIKAFSAKYVTDPSYGSEQRDAFLKAAEGMRLQEALDILNAAQARFDEQK